MKQKNLYSDDPGGIAGHENDPRPGSGSTQYRKELVIPSNCRTVPVCIVFI
jgi:hypothetical protein